MACSAMAPRRLVARPEPNSHLPAGSVRAWLGPTSPVMLSRASRARSWHPHIRAQASGSVSPRRLLDYSAPSGDRHEAGQFYEGQQDAREIPDGW